jgi:hypothetical protein
MSMARHVVAYCDQHLLSNEQVPADPWHACELTVGELHVTVDLCDECREDFEAPLRDLQAADRSREEQQLAVVKPPELAPVPARPRRRYKVQRGPSHTCDLCGKKVDYMARFVHLRGKHPEVMPVLPCPHCDFTEKSCTGLAKHLRTEHPEHYSTQSRAYTFALDKVRPAALIEQGIREATFTPLPG